MINKSKVFYSAFKDEIQAEIDGKTYDEHDREILQKICSEINALAGTNLKYLIELDRLNIPGAGYIIAKHIGQLHSEWAKACLLDPMVQDRIPDGDKMLFRLFKAFDCSEDSLHRPEAHYVRYDDAICRLKPKKIKFELLELAHDPNFAIQLPFTMRMLASWKLPEMKDLLLLYLFESSVDLSSVKGYEGVQGSAREPFLRRKLVLRALNGLKYYPSEDVINAVLPFANDSDADICAAAKKTLKHISSK